MRRERTARVEGRLVGPDGQTPTRTSLSFAGATMTGPNQAGRFSYDNLLPGRYTIVGRAPDSALWGSLEIEVNGEDRLGLVMPLVPAPSIEGRVLFEATTLTPPADASGVRISSRPLMPLRSSINAAADGTFRIPAVDPGRYRLNATLTTGTAATPVAGWVLKSISLNGRDLADVPIDLKPGERVTDVVITFTDRGTEISGTLLDAAGRPAPGYYVVLFSTDESAWTQGSRRVPAPARAATDGRYRFAGLPAGTYFLAAVTNIDAADLADAALLKQLAAAATTVTLAEGEKKSQDLKFSGR
jgi:Carboxypeptidase regulatory-like domain